MHDYITNTYAIYMHFRVRRMWQNVYYNLLLWVIRLITHAI